VTITVDINVLLDVFQKREPHYAASARVVSLVASRKLIGVFPGHALTTLYYLARKHASKPDAEAAMDRVLAAFHIGNLDHATWKEARTLAMTDFEDAAVAMVAKTSASSFIVTRNVDDFVQSPVPAITPADFLSRLTV
jgi:predicted nucleic acid-binding protein